MSIFSTMNNAKKKPVISGKNKDLWLRSLSNEYGQLAQGNKFGVCSTDTIKFITRSEVPLGRDITFATSFIYYRQLKEEPYRIQIVVGGDKLTYDQDPASLEAGLLETKLLINSVISDGTWCSFFYNGFE